MERYGRSSVIDSVVVYPCVGWRKLMYACVISFGFN